MTSTHIPQTQTPTWTGTVHGIYTAPAEGAPTRPRTEVRAVPGMGLDGDRHAESGDAAQVSLIESEAIAAAQRDYGLTLEEGQARRNLVTVGVPLNHLVGREFTVGEVRLRGVSLCEPCGHLQELTGQKVVRALRHRGGLYAEILSGGTIRPGDPVVPGA